MTKEGQRVLAIAILFTLASTLEFHTLQALDAPEARHPAQGLAGIQRQEQKSVRRASTPRTKPVRRIRVRVSRYNSERRQTDSTPTVTAACTRTKDGVVAISRDLKSRFPYGTQVRILHPALTHRVFVIEDLMGEGITKQIDIWTREKSVALQWGIQPVHIEVLQEKAKLHRVPCK